MSLLRIDFSAITRLMTFYEVKISQIPVDLQRRMIDYAADNVLKAVKQNARQMTRGQYALPETDRMAIANAAFIDTKHRNDANPYVEINFRGTVNRYTEPRDIHPIKKDGKWYFSKKKGVIKNGKRRIAEVAFVNEYGVPRNKNQGARGYLSKAMIDGMVKAYEGLADMLEDFIATSLANAI